MIGDFRPTKEQIVAGVALVLAFGVVRARVTPPAPGPLPKAPAVEAPVDTAKDDIAVARPRLIPAARAADGRDPFAASDIWEDPLPLAMPLPPEMPDARVVPVIAIGEGRAKAARPLKIERLPKCVKEEPPPAPPAGTAPGTGMIGGTGASGTVGGMKQ